MFVVQAQVFGGVTGHRVSLCKDWQGAVIEFETREQAEAFAQEQRAAARSPYQTATFLYDVIAVGEPRHHNSNPTRSW